MSGMTLQQVFVVEFTVANQMCDDCHRSEAQDYWRALVSIFLLIILLLNTTSLYITYISTTWKILQCLMHWCFFNILTIK